MDDDKPMLVGPGTASFLLLLLGWILLSFVSLECFSFFTPLPQRASGEGCVKALVDAHREEAARNSPVVNDEPTPGV